MSFQADLGDSVARPELPSAAQSDNAHENSQNSASAFGTLLTSRTKEGRGPESRLHLEVQRDLIQVERLLEEGVRAQRAIPGELAQALVMSGGKRIRPYLTCLSYQSFLAAGAPAYPARGDAQDLYALAAVSEWVHTATLFHDDVLDSSPHSPRHAGRTRLARQQGGHFGGRLCVRRGLCPTHGSRLTGSFATIGANR